MNKEQCLAFLNANQPLPPDRQLTSEIVGDLNRVRLWLRDNPIDEALPLLLRLFGEGDGLGIYQLIEDTVACFPREAVIRELQAILKDASPTIRSWAIEISARYPDASLAETLFQLLPDLDLDSRYAAINALEAFQSADAISFLVEWEKHEDNHELKSLISEILGHGGNATD